MSQRRIAHVHRRLPGIRGGIDYTDPLNLGMVYGVALNCGPIHEVVIHDWPATAEERDWLENYLPTRLAPDALTYHLTATYPAPQPPRRRRSVARWFRDRRPVLVAAAAIIVALVLILLTACGWHGTGTVTQRDYRPGYSYMASYSCGPKSMRSCFEAREMPPVWQLTIRDSAGDTHRVNVSEHDYDADQIGSTFTNGQ